MSTIIADNLTGKTSAGDITVTSEGGAATQSLQQGLAKSWVNFNGTGTIAERDSLNLSSLTDNATGDYDVNLSSSFAAVDYFVNVSGYPSASWNQIFTIQNPANNTTSLFSIFSASTAGTKYDTQLVTASTHGDLA
jgi:hypothetical protein